jgi:integrase
MASIRKRTHKDGTTTYRVDVRLKGFPPQRATFKRLTDARKWGEGTEAAIRENRYFKTAEARKHTFAELVDRYLRDVLPRKPRMKKDQTRQLNWWRGELGHFTLADLTPGRITEARDKLAREPIPSTNKQPKSDSPPRYRSPATINRYLAALSHMLNVAVEEWGWLEDSPMRKVSSFTEPRGRVRFLSDDTTDPHGETIEGERSRLLKACQESSNPYLYPVVVLALSTGMRQGEIMGLAWDDVDLHQGRITLHETKNGERRVVPLVGKALDLLKEHAKVRRIGTPLLFPGKVKTHLPGEVATYKPIDLRTPWETALKAAGIEEFRFHDLRHSTASYLAMNGASLAEIAEVLGHKTLQMVKRYAHLSEAHTAGVVARMNQRIFGDAV